MKRKAIVRVAGEKACEDMDVTCGLNSCEAKCTSDTRSPRLSCGASCSCVGC